METQNEQKIKNMNILALGKLGAIEGRHSQVIKNNQII